MPKRKVEFEAHRIEKVPVKVSFETKEGEKVRFGAHRPEKIAVHVRFTTKK